MPSQVTPETPINSEARHTRWYTKDGKPIEHDPNFRGPLEHRSCTDLLCCLLFLAFIVVWAFLGAGAFYYGNPERLLHPSDSKGRICGYEVPGKYNFTDRPYLYFFDLTKCTGYSTVFEGCPTTQVCVSQCPDHYISYYTLKDTRAMALAKIESFEAGIHQLICAEKRDGGTWYDQMKTFKDVERIVNNGDCTAYVVASNPVLGRCIPSVLIDAGNTVLQGKVDNLTRAATNDSLVPSSVALSTSESFVNAMMQAKGYGEKILEDLNTCWRELVIGLVSAAIVAFLWVVVMRWISGFVIWFSIFALLLLLGGLTGGSWYRYVMLKNSGEGVEFRITIRFKEYFNMTDLIFYAAIVFSVIFLIFAFVLAVMFSRIRIAIELIEEASKAVSSMMSSLLFPIIPFTLQIIVFSYWALVATYLQSYGRENCRRLAVPEGVVSTNASDPWTNVTKCLCKDVQSDEDPYCTFVNYTRDSNLVFGAQVVNLFGLFWGLCFAEALCQLTLAGAFASWYWAYRKPDDVPALPVLKGFYRAIRYHLGSIAFGSLILAIVRLIRALLEWADEKLKRSENPVAKAIMKGLRCLFWVLEKFLKFLSKNAYFLIAIHGKNFCASAKDAFFLLARNVLRVFVLSHVTNFLLFIGKFLITCGFGVLSFYYFSGELTKNVEQLQITLNYYWVPVVIMTCGTYFITDAFFDVYEMAVDTTFFCFLEDSERNDGTPEKPYFMSEDLMKILNKENQFVEAKVG